MSTTGQMSTTGTHPWLALAAVAALWAAAGPAQAAEASGPARVELSDDGPIFVTPAGMSLYTLGADDPTPGKSVCLAEPVIDFPDPTAGFGRMKIPGYQFAAACAAVAPPFLAEANAQPNGDWTLFSRLEGGKQWVYRGRPLYTSVRDAKPGERNGISLDQGGRRGFRIAAAPYDLPPGVKLMRKGEDLVLSVDNQAVFTPRGARLQKACVQCSGDFKPLSAPEVLRIGRPWSVVEASIGERQFVYGGKPLFVTETMTEEEALATGDWDVVVVHKGAGKPAAIGTTYTPTIGDIYTTRAGRSLYIFTCTAPNETVGAPGCDRPQGPAAYWAALCGSGEECARRWRPYLASADAKPSGEWSVIDVSDPMFVDPAGRTYPAEAKRVKAWAYRGRPVFTFHQDKATGDIWGHMMRWHSLAQFQLLPVPGMTSTP